MKLIPDRPVTVYSGQHLHIWFPMIHRHTDGTLFIYYEKGYDACFSPFGKLRSSDNGRTWIAEKENVPRGSWSYSFADGELYELDWYGVVDPKDPNVSWRYGAWSFPGQPTKPVRRDLVRVDSPSTVPVPCTALSVTYPTFPWWDLINKVHGKSEVTAAELQYNPIPFFRFVEDDGVLLALAAAIHRDQVDPKKGLSLEKASLFVFESPDRGRTWKERSVVALGPEHLPEGFSEGTLVRLKDGKLYCVIRTGQWFYHSWSADGGRTWTYPELMKLSDTGKEMGMCWPCLHVSSSGALVMVWGRVGKHMAFDPTGTGRNWQGHLDLHAWELETQALMGVPADQRLRGRTELGERHWDSGDMLSLAEIEPHTFLVCYDVQSYRESWNSHELDSAIRMVRVKLE